MLWWLGVGRRSPALERRESGQGEVEVAARGSRSSYRQISLLSSRLSRQFNKGIFKVYWAEGGRETKSWGEKGTKSRLREEGYRGFIKLRRVRIYPTLVSLLVRHEDRERSAPGRSGLKGSESVGAGLSTHIVSAQSPAE